MRIRPAQAPSVSPQPIVVPNESVKDEHRQYVDGLAEKLGEAMTLRRRQELHTLTLTQDEYRLIGADVERWKTDALSFLTAPVAADELYENQGGSAGEHEGGMIKNLAARLIALVPLPFRKIHHPKEVQHPPSYALAKSPDLTVVNALVWKRISKLEVGLQREFPDWA